MRGPCSQAVNKGAQNVDCPGREEGMVPNFDVAGKGWMPRLQQSSVNHCLMVLGMAESNRLAWLRGGEALQRILLEATRLDYVVSLASQVVEVPSYRADLETWTTTDLLRTDGVPVYAIPHPGPSCARRLFDLDVSSTSPDADRPSRSNADLEATRSQHDHFGDWRLTWPPRSHPEPSAR